MEKTCPKDNADAQRILGGHPKQVPVETHDAFVATSDRSAKFAANGNVGRTRGLAARRGK